MIGPTRPPGEASVDDLEPVRAPLVESERRADRVEQLVESAGDHADDAAGRVDAGDELVHAVGRADAGPDLGEHALGQPGEGRDALPQALGEVELAAHRALGHLGDEVARAGGIREQFDHLVLDQGGVGVEHHEEARVARRADAASVIPR